MRTLLHQLETMAAWKLILSSTVLGALFAFGGVVAGVLDNPGGYELAQILATIFFIALLLLFVRRRQHDSWSSAVQLSIIRWSAGWLAIIALRGLAPALFEGQSIFGAGPRRDHISCSGICGGLGIDDPCRQAVRRCKERARSASRCGAV